MTDTIETWEKKLEQLKHYFRTEEAYYEVKSVLKYHIDELLAETRKEGWGIKMFAEHLTTLKDGEVDVRKEAKRFIKSIQSLTEEQISSLSSEQEEK